MTEREKIHRLMATPETVHTGFFDSALAPVLTINSSDTVRLSTMMAMNDQLKPDMTLQEWIELRKAYADSGMGPHTLTGPIYVKEARPGDVLEVRIQKLTPIDWGVNLHLPGSLHLEGLEEDSIQGQMKTFTWDKEKTKIRLMPKVFVPLTPFLGVMGVAPRIGERRSSEIPEYFGGNMDNKELIAGAILYLPVIVEGALFSTGDAHASQGDGEVNGTAIETAMEEAVLQFVVRKDLKIERPMAETPTHWIMMGFHKELDKAQEIVLEEVIRFLIRTKGLGPDEAYGLASVAVDFRVTQVVNINKGVHAMIPKDIFPKMS